MSRKSSSSSSVCSLSTDEEWQQSPSAIRRNKQVIRQGHKKLPSDPPCQCYLFKYRKHYNEWVSFCSLHSAKTPQGRLKPVSKLQCDENGWPVKCQREARHTYHVPREWQADTKGWCYATPSDNKELLVPIKHPVVLGWLSWDSYHNKMVKPYLRAKGYSPVPVTMADYIPPTGNQIKKQIMQQAADLHCNICNRDVATDNWQQHINGRAHKSALTGTFIGQFDCAVCKIHTSGIAALTQHNNSVSHMQKAGMMTNTAREQYEARNAHQLHIRGTTPPGAVRIVKEQPVSYVPKSPVTILKRSTPVENRGIKSPSYSAITPPSASPVLSSSNSSTVVSSPQPKFTPSVPKDFNFNFGTPTKRKAPTSPYLFKSRQEDAEVSAITNSMAKTKIDFDAIVESMVAKAPTQLNPVFDAHTITPGNGHVPTTHQRVRSTTPTLPPGITTATSFYPILKHSTPYPHGCPRLPLSHHNSGGYQLYTIMPGVYPNTTQESLSYVSLEDGLMEMPTPNWYRRQLTNQGVTSLKELDASTWKPQNITMHSMVDRKSRSPLRRSSTPIRNYVTKSWKPASPIPGHPWLDHKEPTTIGDDEALRSYLGWPSSHHEQPSRKMNLSELFARCYRKLKSQGHIMSVIALAAVEAMSVKMLIGLSVKAYNLVAPMLYTQVLLLWKIILGVWVVGGIAAITLILYALYKLILKRVYTNLRAKRSESTEPTRAE